MTDPFSARSEARASRQRQLDNLLAELGLTRADHALFVTINYGIRIPPADLPSSAPHEYSPCADPVVTEEECRVALAAGLARGWLQVVDESARAKIVDELRSGGVLGPIYRLPDVGCVDFTDAGAALWHRLCDRSRPGKPPPFAYTDVVREKTAWYFRTRAAAVAAIEEARGQEDVVAVTGPTPTGPWRAQWWRRFPEGYRVDAEERRQWQGHCSGGGENCYLDLCPQPADVRRLRDALDRHNVTLAEWLLLTALEDSWLSDSAASLCASAVRWSESQVGVPISEDECRGALGDCLRYGWLRVLDRSALEEVHTHLRNDPVVLALPRTAEYRPRECHFTIDPARPGQLIPAPVPPEYLQGRIDFSPTGATLYRMISAEWLGPDWEDHLRVSNGYYWEEHHYCEVEEGFDRIVQEHVAEGETVRASRVVAIGPWCVYWWERFPAGYRLELELGEP